MKKLIALILLLPSLALGANYLPLKEPPAQAAISMSVVPSRTSGVAPLCVFFDASGTTAAGLTSAPFHEIEYTWNFGDTANLTAAWTQGTRTDSGSKNKAYGPVAAHCYESATGSPFTACVTAKYNTSTNTQCATPVAVSAWSDGATTICIANGTLPVAGVNACPASSTVRQGTGDFDADMTFALGNNCSGAPCKRILFKKGDTFSASATSSMGNASGPGIVGAYGSSGANPLIQATSDDIGFFGITDGLTDWRFIDLELDANTHSGTTGFFGNGAPTKTQLTFLRMTTDTVATGYGIDAGTQPDQLFMVDSILNNTTGEGTFVWASRYALLGTLFDGGCCNDGHPMNLSRNMGLSKAVLSNNTFVNITGTGGSAITVRTHDQVGDPQSGQTIVSENDVTSGSDFHSVNFAPSGINLHNQQLVDIIFERNWVKCNNNGCGNTVRVEGVDKATVRNNLMKLDSTQGVGIHLRAADGFNATSNRVYNNSIFATTSAAVSCAYYESAAVISPVTQNNLCYAPSSSSPSFNIGSAGGTPVTSNNTTNFTTSPTWGNSDNPTTAAQYKPSCTGITYPCAQGTVDAVTLVPVWSDFSGAAEPATRDIGAVAH